MNYIYDIYLNLLDKPYDFFEWNKNDKIVRVKKIPIYKTYTHILIKLIGNEIKIDDNFLISVHNKTELWNINDKIEYCALFCDSNNIVAIEFNEMGNSIKKSFLLIEEELEITQTISKLKEIELDFKVLKNSELILETRKETKDKSFINNELENIDVDKLGYVFFECFGRRENNKQKMINKIQKISTNSKVYRNLYDILKLTAGSHNKML